MSFFLLRSRFTHYFLLEYGHRQIHRRTVLVAHLMGIRFQRDCTNRSRYPM